MRIAIVEDELAQQTLLVRTLEQQLERDGAVHCQAFFDGLALQRVLRHESFDLVILDWSVPGMDGLELLRWLRIWKESSVPVLMISSKGAEEDVAEALNSGADDYIVKPFRPVELRARVLRLLKLRTVQSPTGLLNVGRWTLDPVSHLVLYRGALGTDSERYTLTSREFSLILLLFSRLGQTVSRAHLLEKAGYEMDASSPSRTLDSHIYRLRKKLVLDARRGMFLRTVYGKGYQLGWTAEEGQ